MPEPNREMDTPADYDTALTEFFTLLNRNTATNTSIEMALNGLFQHTVSTTPEHMGKLVHGFSERYSYDVAGILMDRPEDADEAGETTDERVFDQKLQLLAKVTALLVGSEYSRLTDKQREALLTKACQYAETNLGEGTQETFADALLLFIAHDAEWAIDGDPAQDARRKRGKRVLRIAYNHVLTQGQYNLFNRALKRRNRL